ncbi:MAG: DEAD/DEAH box helicase [Burkholderiaceae bacterium]|nr:MAG: DEAD/DEAH box helicase [Burkholderiaceae bacterium]TBR76770.1 MAG: DEAD/DEAH box helicase [Burkholderiaceae bacterium]
MPVAQSILSRLKLADPELALLCVPGEFVDCTNLIDDLDNVDDSGQTSHLLSVQVTDRIKAFSRDKKPLYGRGGVLSSLEQLQRLGFHAWRDIGRLQIEVQDSFGHVAQLSSFTPWSWRTIQVGRTLHLIGTVKRYGPTLYLNSDLEPPEGAIGGIWTRYKGVQGQVSAESVEQAVHDVRYRDDAYLKAEREIVASLQMDEAAVLDLVQYDQNDVPVGAPRFLSLRDFIRTLHMPATVAEGERALLLANRITAAGIRAEARSGSVRYPSRDAPLIVPDQQILDLAATQPEVLTEDQRDAALGIARSLRSPTPMNALLSGDVGTGKTLAFLLPAVVAHQNGARVAIMAPTIILANQIARQIATRFHDSIRGVERVLAGKKIQNPGHILVGTSGLPASCSKSGYVPNLLVLDEQHKLSVQTRGALVGPATHVLEATATPIPRSLATVFFDGVQVFSLKKSPVKRDIKSHVLDVNARAQVSRAMRETVELGRRVLVVYPRLQTVEVMKKSRQGKDEQLSLGDDLEVETKRSVQGVIEAAHTFEAAFPGKVAVLHGLLSDEEKEQVIEQVRSLEKPVLVASVVVETGIDIPDIGLLVVRDADRMGLSQLHQLRGRLARNGGGADFFMMVESLDEVEDSTLERLVACRSTTDGYRLAEIDMKQRGFGSYVDDSQSGASQGVFRLTRIAPADFLGIACVTAAANQAEETGPVDHQASDRHDAYALMRRVRREVAALRAERVVGVDEISPPCSVRSAGIGQPPGSVRFVRSPAVQKAGMPGARALNESPLGFTRPATAGVVQRQAVKPIDHARLAQGFRPPAAPSQAALDFNPLPVPTRGADSGSKAVPGFPPRRIRAVAPMEQAKPSKEFWPWSERQTQ